MNKKITGIPFREKKKKKEQRWWIDDSQKVWSGTKIRTGIQGNGRQNSNIPCLKQCQQFKSEIKLWVAEGKSNLKKMVGGVKTDLLL